MADERRPSHSLKEQSADQIRNRQRGGESAPAPSPQTDSGGEANASMRQVWSEPGGEANNYRNAMVGAGTKADDHGELTAAETPEATRHLGDATLGARDRDATADAIARATAVTGEDAPADADRDAATTAARRGGTVPATGSGGSARDVDVPAGSARRRL